MRSQTNNSSAALYSTRLLWTLLAAIGIVLGLHLLLQYLNLQVFYQQNGQVYELSNRFDLDDESSVPSWFSQALFLAIGAGAGLAAYLQTNKPIRRLWQVIAALGLLFSIDEVSTLHEHVLQTVHVLFFKDASPTGLANAWWLVAPFILLAGGWMLWKMMRLLPRRTMLLFGIAGLAFLSGAIVIDLLTSIVPRETFLNQGILVASEETLELLGTATALYAIINYLETRHHTSLARAIKQLRDSGS